MRTFENFDALDIVRIHEGEIVTAIGAARVIDRHAVNQNQGLTGRGAANAHAGIATKAAILVDRDAGRGGDGIKGEVKAQLIDVFFGDDADAGADFRLRLAQSRAFHSNRVQMCFGIFGCLCQYRKRKGKRSSTKQDVSVRHNFLFSSTPRRPKDRCTS